MEVTDVRRVRGTWLITLNGETLRIPRALYEERPITVGDDIDPEEYDRWLLLRQFRPALDYAVSLLARRPHAEGELEAKLKARGCRPVTIELVLHKLSKHGLTDDADFARQWAEARVRRGVGPKRIEQELRQRKIAAEDAEEAMAGLDEDGQRAAAVKLAQKALRAAKPGEDRRKTDQRIAAMLIRRGYPYTMAREAIRAVREDDQEETDDDRDR